MTAEQFSIGYHKRSRDKYAAIRAEREVALGDSKSFCDRVSSVEGKAEASASKESTPIRQLQPPPMTAMPVGSWRSEKSAAPDVKGAIRDHKAMKSAKRGGSRKR